MTQSASALGPDEGEAGAHRRARKTPRLSRGLGSDFLSSSRVLGCNFKSPSQKTDTRSLEQFEKPGAPDLVTGLSPLPPSGRGLCEPSDRAGAGS